MTEPARSATDNDLVKVAYARDQGEAEFLQSLLRDADVGSVVRRAAGFDVPEFLAAGPRDVLVAASDASVAREVLRPDDSGTQSQSRHDRRTRVLAALLIGAALVALVGCVAAGVFS